MEHGLQFVLNRSGIDSEADYPYKAMGEPCWAAAEKRVVAQITNFTVLEPTEAALLEAAGRAPVSVAIEADQPGFQGYKSGVFDAACGTKLDHGVLVVGMRLQHAARAGGRRREEPNEA